MKITKEQLKKIIKEELEATLQENYNEDPVGQYILLMKPGGETLADLRYYRVQHESVPRPNDPGVSFSHIYVMRDGEKIYLPMNNMGSVAVPSPFTGDELIGSSERNRQGRQIPLGPASASVGKLTRQPRKASMGQP